ncbi:MAG TPA: general secretion pathway protein GspB [Gammaproteobacteria bacterium]
MSMILDALRKSDRERTRQAADRLRDGPAIASEQKLNGWLLATLTTGLLFAIAALLIALWPDSPAADRTATGGVAEIMENEQSDVRATVRDLSNELARAEPEITSKPPEPAMASEPAPVRAEIVENLAAPPLEALPASIRIKLPALHVDIHAWAEDPRDRFVLINLRRYEEGDRLREGLTLHRIMRNGVVLEFEGTLFTLPRQ